MRTRRCLFRVPGTAFRITDCLASLLMRSDDFNGYRHMTREAVVGRLIDSIEDFDYQRHGSGGQRNL